MVLWLGSQVSRPNQEAAAFWARDAGATVRQELGNTPTVERRGQSSLPWPPECGTLQLKPDQDTLRPGKRDANSLPACMRNSSRRCPVLLSARAQLTLSHWEHTPASKPDHRKQAQQDTLLCIEDWEGSTLFGPPGEKPKVPAGRERSPRKLVTPQPTLCPQPLSIPLLLLTPRQVGANQAGPQHPSPRAKVTLPKIQPPQPISPGSRPTHGDPRMEAGETLPGWELAEPGVCGALPQPLPPQGISHSQGKAQRGRSKGTDLAQQ